MIDDVLTLRRIGGVVKEAPIARARASVANSLVEATGLRKGKQKWPTPPGTEIFEACFY